MIRALGFHVIYDSKEFTPVKSNSLNQVKKSYLIHLGRERETYITFCNNTCEKFSYYVKGYTLNQAGKAFRPTLHDDSCSKTLLPLIKSSSSDCSILAGKTGMYKFYSKFLSKRGVL